MMNVELEAGSEQELLAQTNRRRGLFPAVALGGAALGLIALAATRAVARPGPVVSASDSLPSNVVSFAEKKKTCFENGKPVRFAPPPKPAPGTKQATKHNGVKLDSVCVQGDGPYHVFVIGDWGGLIDNTKDGKLKAVSHLNHRWNETPAYGFHWPVDEDCQWRVRDQMAKLAPKSKPGYVLNMGDNFYWGGVEDYCGADDITKPYNNGGTTGPYSWAYKKGGCNQFQKIFEEVYVGAHLEELMWLGVLGNHDWGGWRMDMAWDQAIGYTWAKDEHYSKDRWMTPALYWSVLVEYPDFSVDYYFMDTNVFDALDWDERPPHNICGPHNPTKPSCSSTGGPPGKGGECQQWFNDLWDAQLEWLEGHCDKSKAEWRIVVTHFPPNWGRHQWPVIAKKNELDVIITGHRHSQNMHFPTDPVAKVWPEDKNDHLMNDFMDPTAWIVAGGGGGITSEHSPHKNGEDDQYGFLDMTLTKEWLRFDMISHGGVLRRSNKQPHYYSHGGVVNTVTTTTTTPAPKVDKDGNELKKVTQLFNKEKKYDTVQVYDNPSDKSKKSYIDNETEVKVLGENTYWRHIEWTDKDSGEKKKGWCGHQNLRQKEIVVKKD